MDIFLWFVFIVITLIVLFFFYSLISLIFECIMLSFLEDSAGYAEEPSV